ncbi:MAG TPA: hypothetical protein VF406_18060 [Thermodesulfobacteriota bacterium]
MTLDGPTDEPTPLMPPAPAPTPGPGPVAETAAVAPDPPRMPPEAPAAGAPAPPARAWTAWRLLAVVVAPVVAWALVGPGDLPGPPHAAVVTEPAPPAPAPHAAVVAEPAPPAPAPLPDAATTAPARSGEREARPASTGPVESPRRPPRPRHARRPAPAPHASPPPRRPPSPVELARTRYHAGDLAGARAALAGARGEVAVALLARLDAIARLLGEGERWPPPGGAAALERLLELEAGLGLPEPGPFASRARRSLADSLAEKGHRLADDGRWEEALDAFRRAADLESGHAGAAAGLERTEAEAEARYLEAYAGEDADLDAARRLYERAARLARPGGPLAARIARALERLSRR